MISVLIISAVTFGAIGDGVHDDRPAIQAALDVARDTGDAVFLPRGTYLVSPSGVGYYALRVDGVAVFGEDAGATVLRQAPWSGNAVRLIYATGANVVLEDLELDGNSALQTVNEHRHGVFAHESDGLTVRRVTARHFTGDGFYLYDGTRDSLFDDALATANGRNGITFGANVAGAVLRDSSFVGNDAQQVDSEPGKHSAVVSDVTITGCLVDGIGSDEYALTVSGTASTTPAQRWRVVGNEIRGGVHVVWAEHVTIAGNTIRNATSKPSVTVQRHARHVAVVGNDITSTTLLPDIAAVRVFGTLGSAPSRVLIAGNRLEASGVGFGVRADGALDVDVIENEILGGAAAIRLRSTIVERPFERATVLGNRAHGYTRAGVEVYGPGVFLRLDIERNELDGSGPAIMIADGVVL